MADAGPVVAALAAVVALLLLGAVVVSLRAVLDARGAGMASIAVLAPLAEGARLVRRRAVGGRAGWAPVAAGALLLVSPVVRVLALPIAGPAPLGAAPGPIWSVVADAIWWAGAALLVGRRVLPAAVALEAALVAALAATATALGGAGSAGAPLGRLGVPPAAEAPVAFLLLVVGGGVLLPWAVRPAVSRLGGVARLLAGAGLAAQPVAAAATGALLLLGPGPRASLLAVVAVLLACALVLAERRFPVLSLPRLVRLGARVLVPLAAVQLGIVLALALLA
ncbi:hypothetical protein [Amnibacterium kyonggiense]